jgi:hypothetical protein
MEVGSSRHAYPNANAYSVTYGHAHNDIDGYPRRDSDSHSYCYFHDCTQCYPNSYCRRNWYASTQANTGAQAGATYADTNCYRNTIPYTYAERYA